MEEQEKKSINFLTNVIYGVFMGIFEVIPGISGGTLAFILGIYETLIGAISNIKKDFKKSFKILLPILIGMGIGVYCFSYLMSFLNKNFPMEVNFCLTGLIVGIIPSIAMEAFSLLNPFLDEKINRNRKVFKTNPLKLYSSIFTFMIMIFVMILINYFSFTLDATGEIIENLTFFEFLRFFVVGALAAYCLMLPGCSGSLIMLVFGTYYSVIEAIHKINIPIIFTVGFGILFGLFFGAKIIEYCLKKFKAQTFFAILGLIISSSISPFLNFVKSCYKTLTFEFLIVHGLFSVIFLALGIISSVSLSTKFKNKS